MSYEHLCYIYTGVLCIKREMITINDINNMIIQAVNTMVEVSLKQLQYLYHKTGVIKEKIDNETYVVIVDGNEFTVKGYNYTYQVNDVVDILFENNSNYRIILYKIGNKG